MPALQDSRLPEGARSLQGVTPLQLQRVRGVPHALHWPQNHIWVARKKGEQVGAPGSDA